MQHIFIINPHAGKKDQTGRIYEMADRLRQHGLTCQCLLTQRPGGAEEIARRLVSSGEEVRLYACGGDGTLNEVVNGAAGFDNAAVTCIPIGTGSLRTRKICGTGRSILWTLSTATAANV